MHRPRMNIGIKKMGEVNLKPFRDACSKRFRSGNWDEKFGNWEEKSVMLCSSWQREISDPGWQPFKQETVNGKLTVGYFVFYIITRNRNTEFLHLKS